MRTRRLILALAVVACGRALVAQSPYSSVTPPTSAGGGYVAAPMVPYQSTTPTPVVPYQPSAPTQLTPVYTMPGPVPLPPNAAPDPTSSQAWQPYSNLGAPTASTAVVGDLPIPATAFPNQPLYPTAPGTAQGKSLLPAGTRSGAFQKVNFDATWIPQLEGDSLGWTDLSTNIVFGLPFFTRETPIVITPQYVLHFLGRPQGFDLPPRLHDLTLDLHHFRRLNENWIVDFALTPGLYGDDHSLDSSDAVRLNGRAMAIYESSPAWKWIAGVSYLDGAWAKIVPIFGFNFEPSDDVKYQAVFPSPKASWRLPNSPRPGQDEYWVYVEGDFGNAIWAIEQSDGTPDIFASRDWRLILGVEHKVIGGLTSRAEIGYIFNREIKVASVGGNEIDIADSFMLRIGLSY